MIRSIAFLAAALFASATHAETYADASRIVTVGGPVTEIVYALGEEDRIIARDTTSVFPAEANALPDVGYMRRLSAEGVLSVAPDLIIARSTSGPIEAIDQLKSASIPIVFVEDTFTAEAVIEAINTVGTALGATEKSEALAADVQADLDRLAAKVSDLEAQQRVLFILSMDGGRVNAAGSGTGANGIIELAGGINVMAESYSGYKLVDAEAIIEAAPDVVLMMDGRGNHSGRKEEVLSLPAIALTPAGQNDGFITVPGAALGFGPRTGQLGLELHDSLYGGAG
ncbi:MAG: ABC transporter substrate-binding protein [Rhodobacteraceae bacterium]|nr:ABC transporter substrate-binding protein [Paracoccaceae bacterium]